MKSLLAILSLALIYAPAFAVNENAYEHANRNASFLRAVPVPEPGTLALFAGAGITVLLLKLLKK